MQLDLLLDNDVLIKCSCYSLLDEVGAARGESGKTIGVLGAARFVVPKHLERRGKILDRESALARFNAFLASASELEPSSDEIELASLIEEAAARSGVELDSGESQLCAIAVKRGPVHLITGDKRAISGAETILTDVAELSTLRGMIVCLEQVIMGATEQLGTLEIRGKVCAEPHIDKALSICFQCSSADPRPESFVDGLLSYVRHLRSQTVTLLFADDQF